MQEPTAFDVLYAKVKENQKKRKTTEVRKAQGVRTRKKQIDGVAEQAAARTTVAKFTEDDNYMVYEVGEHQEKSDFPTPSEEEDNAIMEDGEIVDASTNKNATVLNAVSNNEVSTQGSIGATTSSAKIMAARPVFLDEGPSTSTGIKAVQDENAQLKRSVTIMQELMIKKGLMTSDELDAVAITNQLEQQKSGCGLQTTKRKTISGKSQELNDNISSSEVTVYQRAVPIINQDNPDLAGRIDKLISDTRRSEGKNVSTSSDDMMDTSDETKFITGHHVGLIVHDADIRPPVAKTPEKTPEEKANKIICGAEQARARVLDIQGKSPVHFAQNILAMDNDYQMIDSHVDKPMRRRILNFEYIDLSKLLTKNRIREDDQRLEIVNRNGMTFLSPVSDRDSIQINSYIKWEQAFRIYSNVITSHYPVKAPELLQYNHTIHTASQAYIWENVYSYDKEFRHHISRYPDRVWNVILQQVWTMILKDRIKYDNFNSKKGGNSSNRKEPCRRFNKGHFTIGLSCKYDHRCSVKKCSKFGYGAHICRLRDAENSNSGPSAAQPAANVEHK